MKFITGPTRAERIEAKEVWHRWFAWRPVRIGKTRDVRWLEVIERKGENCEGWWFWRYRPIKGHIG